MSRILPCLLPLLLLAGCGPGEDALVVYTSQDRVYAERILERFTGETGIRVSAVYDSELVKTRGLASRLVAERSRPRCSLFWSNEEMMVRDLERQGVVEQVATFGYRTRRLVVNTGLVDEESLSLEDLADPRWKGRVALAYPLYGTTATHFMALRAAWGAERFERWCRDLVDNQARVVGGNSMVVRLVGMGEAAVGLTDIDDVEAGRRNGLPIRALPPSGELSLIANSAALVAGGPRREQALVLQEYLGREETLAVLVEGGALEGTDPRGVPSLAIDWEAALPELEQAGQWLARTFMKP